MLAFTFHDNGIHECESRCGRCAGQIILHGRGDEGKMEHRKRCVFSVQSSKSEILKAPFLFKSKIDRDFRNLDRNEVVDLKLNQKQKTDWTSASNVFLPFLKASDEVAPTIAPAPVIVIATGESIDAGSR